MDFSKQHCGFFKKCNVPTHTADLASPKQMVVAVDFQYAPFSALTPTVEPTGLFIDMWNYGSLQTGIEVGF
jgi:hypothetical protein